MDKAGFTRVATTLGLGSLLAKQMVTSDRRTDQDGDEYTVYTITPRGFAWLLNNQDRLVLRRSDVSSAAPRTDDDIPF